MDEEHLRKMAVEQYLQGKAPISIYLEIGRTKAWFFKWLHRYRTGDPDWYRDKPKTPHRHPRETSPEMKKLVKNIRIDLEEHPYAQIGISAIKWEFKKLAVTPPSDRTIHRILKKEGLVKKNFLCPQGSGVSLFHHTSWIEQHPSSRSFGPKIHQKRWPFLFASYHRSLQPSSLHQSSAQERRSGCGPGAGPLLEDNGNPRLSSGRQPTLLPWEQSLSSFLWHRPQALPFAGNRNGLHPHRRTLA